MVNGAVKVISYFLNKADFNLVCISGAWNGGWGGDDDGQWKGDNGKNYILQLKWIWTKFANSGAWNGGWGGDDGQWKGDGDDGSWKGEGGKSNQLNQNYKFFNFVKFQVGGKTKAVYQNCILKLNVNNFIK